MLMLALAAGGYVVLRDAAETDEDRLAAEVEGMLGGVQFDGVVEVPASAPGVTASQPESVGAVSGTAGPVPVVSTATATGPMAGPATSQADVVGAAGVAASAPASGESLKDGLDLKIVSAEVVPGVILRQPDGSIRVDDRFTLIGAGTKDDPLQLTWEYLISASETYRPREGKRQLPQRIAMLHGKWITIQGNIAFPLAATSPKEILAMLNMWDGCCIGLPPTPYDAIEVRLAEAAPASRKHTMTYGTLTGKMSVEPYLVETWLAGLYLLDDATLNQGL